MARHVMTDVFVEVADTLVDDFDRIGLLHLLAERRVDQGQAFERLRAAARNRDRRLADLARAVADGSALPA